MSEIQKALDKPPSKIEFGVLLMLAAPAHILGAGAPIALIGALTGGALPVNYALFGGLAAIVLLAIYTASAWTRVWATSIAAVIAVLAVATSAAPRTWQPYLPSSAVEIGVYFLVFSLIPVGAHLIDSQVNNETEPPAAPTES